MILLLILSEGEGARGVPGRNNHRGNIDVI